MTTQPPAPVRSVNFDYSTDGLSLDCTCSGTDDAIIDQLRVDACHKLSWMAKMIIGNQLMPGCKKSWSNQTFFTKVISYWNSEHPEARVALTSPITSTAFIEAAIRLGIAKEVH